MVRRRWWQRPGLLLLLWCGTLYDAGFVIADSEAGPSQRSSSDPEGPLPLSGVIRDCCILCNFAIYVFKCFIKFIKLHAYMFKRQRACKKWQQFSPGAISLVDGLIDGDNYVRHLLTESDESDNEIKVRVAM